VTALRRATGAGFVVLALAGCGTTGRAATIEAKLQRHLADRSLSVKWVRCVAGASSTYRCNVNFGDPHVQIYCAALVDGSLRTAEWRQAEYGRQDRAASARECARRLGKS
jgi:hypothetical protein